MKRKKRIRQVVARQRGEGRAKARVTKRKRQKAREAEQTAWWQEDNDELSG